MQEWTWPTDEENAGYIHARALPAIGEWKKCSPEKIEKIVKKNEKLKNQALFLRLIHNLLNNGPRQFQIKKVSLPVCHVCS